MEWTTIISSVLAGGLAGQLTVAWLNRRKDLKLAELNASLDIKREFSNWLRQERFRASTDLIDLVSSHYSRTEFDDWPDKIRAASVRIHLLERSGTAPKELADVMQKVFQMALDRKLGRIKKDRINIWNRSFRDATRELREILARQIHDANV